MAAAQDIHQYLKELATGASRSDTQGDESLAELLRQTALLELMADTPPDESEDLALLYITSLDPAQERWTGYLRTIYLFLFSKDKFGIDATGYSASPHIPPSTELILIRGAQAVALARFEEGTHLFCPAHHNFAPIQVGVLSLIAGEDPMARFAAILESRQAWLGRLADGKAKVEDAPMPFLPVLRIYQEQGPVVDVRTGLLDPSWRYEQYNPLTALRTGLEGMLTFLLSALPLPPELHS